MAYTQLADGIWWPWHFRESPININTSTAGTLDAAGEKYAMIGRVKIAGSPGTSKTINTTGSSKIEWLGGGTAIFDNASSSLSVGIQGVTSTPGNPAQPDGTFGLTAVLTTAADASPTLTTASAWHTATPTSGSATLTDGDIIAVVWDLTARGGSDAIQVVPAQPSNSIFPTTNAFASAAWGAAGASQAPNVLIIANDGTLITIDGTRLFGLATTQTGITDSANPDEYGTLFQVPFGCKVDAMSVGLYLATLDSDFTLFLSSAPTTSRSTMASIAVEAAQSGPFAATNNGLWNLATPIELAANTEYCVSFKATSTGEIRLRRGTLGNANARQFFNGGTTVYGTTANNGGNFAAGSTTAMNYLSVRISAIDFPAGGGGSALHLGGLGQTGIGAF